MSPCLSRLFLPFESGLCFTWHRADLPGEAGKHASCVLGFVFRPPTPRHPQASAGGDRGAGISIHGALPAQQALSWCPSSASRPPPFPGGGDTSCSSSLSHHSHLPVPRLGQAGRQEEGGGVWGAAGSWEAHSWGRPAPDAESKPWSGGHCSPSLCPGGRAASVLDLTGGLDSWAPGGLWGQSQSQTANDS